MKNGGKEMSEFRQTIAMLRKEKGLSQAELAEKLGVRKTTISNYETGYSTPDRRMLLLLAELFDVSVDFLLGVGDNDTSLEEPFFNLQPIPVVGEVRAGNPTFAQEEILDYLYVPRDFVKGYDYFGLVVNGDSMNMARLLPGDVLLVRRQTTADNGDIVIASFGGEEATVKRYYQNGERVILRPESSNPTYLPIEVDLSTDADFVILGKVVRAVINL